MIATILLIGSSNVQPTEEKHINKLASKIEIKIKGGFSIHALVKNAGMTDHNNVYIHIILDGTNISPGCKDREVTMNMKAATTYFLIIPVRGFGATNIVPINTITETASATFF